MKKKISKKTLIIVLVCVLALFGVCGFIAIRISEQNTDNENLFMALRYLEHQNCDSAEDYLTAVGEVAFKKTSFVKDAAEIIRQHITGNQTLKKIEIDMLYNDYIMDNSQVAVAEYLAAMTDDVSATDYTTIVGQLINMMELSEKKQFAYQTAFEMEYQVFVNGGMSNDMYQRYVDMVGEEAAQNLEISAMLSEGNYSGTFYKVAERLQKQNSDENKLLLADTIAAMSYGSSSMDTNYLYNAFGVEYDAAKIQKQQDKLKKKIDKVQKEIDALTFQLNAATNGEKVTKINVELEALYDKKSELENKKDKALVYKALNSIANINSVESDVVKAKLYYAVNEKEKAVEILTKSADSLHYALSDNQAVKAGLEVLNNLAEGKSYSEKSMRTILPEVVENMMSSVHEGIKVRDGYYYYGNSLISDLSSAALAQFKYANNDIYITSFDYNNYPDITMTLNGREELLKEVVNKKTNLRDTHYDVDYNAEFEEISMSSICFVVDTSGSMDGAAIENAKDALVSFAKQLNEETEISLVEFNSGATIRTELSENVIEFIAASESLVSGGGTDIGSGISEGLKSLQKARGVKTILLMTDGQSSLDMQVVEQAKKESVTIYTIGFGSVDSVMLEQIAEATGGTFTLADSSGDLMSVYESIGSILGNSVRVTYTVKDNPDEMNRYVHVASEQFGTTDKYEYMLAVEEKMSDSFCMQEGYVFSRENMQYNKDSGQKMGIHLGIPEGLKVDYIEVEGETIKYTEDSYGYFEISPITKEGLYDIKICFTDGSEYIAEECILIYEQSLQNTFQWNASIRLGCLQIESFGAYEMSDGTMVLHGAFFRECDVNQNTLSARTSNLLVMDECTVGTEYYQDTRYYNWGDSGKFHLDGLIYLESSDAQSKYSYATISSMGKLTGVSDQKQCTITAN